MARLELKGCQSLGTTLLPPGNNGVAVCWVVVEHAEFKASLVYKSYFRTPSNATEKPKSFLLAKE